MSAKKLKPKKSKSHRKTKSEPKKLPLKKIAKEDPEFELAYDIKLGIRHAVSLAEPSYQTQTQSENATDSQGSDSDSEELQSQFEEMRKMKFPKKGGPKTPGHAMNDFKFKDYCPEIFRQLREWFGIDPGEYIYQVAGNFDFFEFMSNSKSGQFFFYSQNQQFIIKTMTHNESLFLRKILPQYFAYISRQPNTLLCKIFGMHRVKTHNHKRMHFMIMSNVFYSPLDLPIHAQYDLKGSTKGRCATKEEKDAGAILKDLDFLESKQFLNVGVTRAKLFKEQLRKDTEFLRKCKIMDYSLLVGICYRDEYEKLVAETEEQTEQTMAPVAPSFPPPELTIRVDPPPNETLESAASSRSPKKSTDDNTTESFAPPRMVMQDSANNNDEKPLASSLMTDTDSMVLEKSSAVAPPNSSKARVKHPKLYRVKTFRSVSPIVNSEMDDEKHNPQPHKDATSAAPAPQFQARKIRLSINENTTSNPLPNPAEDTTVNPFTSEYGGMCGFDSNGKKGNEIYFIGIIDILQKYNRRKRLENFLISMKHEEDTISCVRPELYAKRMREFLNDKIG